MVARVCFYVSRTYADARNTVNEKPATMRHPPPEMRGMTLTTAPELTTLADLAFDWRHVASNPGYGVITVWHGDLNDPGVHREYQRLVQAGCIVVTTHRTATGGHLFAKLAGRDPDGPAAMPQPVREVPVAREVSSPASRWGTGPFAVHPALRPRRHGRGRVAASEGDLDGGRDDRG